MLALLHIAALGPHADTTVAFPDPMGHTEISGGSEVGKTTLADAVCLALWGVGADGRPFPVEQIREGADKAVVEATTARGTVVGRTLTRRRSMTRTMTAGGATESFSTEDGIRAKLGPLGARAELGRLIVAPMQWVALLQKDLGRPLRDLLLSVLPGGDTRAVVAAMLEAGGHELRDADPLDLQAALKAQTAANSARDAARGRLEAARTRSAAATAATVDAPSDDAVAVARATLAARDAWARHGSAGDLRAARDARIAALRQRLDAPGLAGPAEEQVAKAGRVLEALAAWEKHDAAVERYRVALANHAETTKRRDDVRARRAELGERPTFDGAALIAKQAQLARVTPTLAGFKEAVETARAAVALADGEAKKLAGHGEDCPTCGQRWAERADARAAADTALREKRAALKAAEERLEKNQAGVAAVEAEIAALKQAEAEARTWDQRNRDIGPEPNVGAPPTEPKAPEVQRPEPQHIAWARNVQREQAEAAGAAKRDEQERAIARRDLAALEAETVAVAGEPDAPRPGDDDVRGAEQVLRDQAAAEGAFRRMEQEQAAAARELDAATKAADATAAEASRVAALVDACRRAPTEIARQRAEALGDMGPVTLRFPPKETRDTPEIEVLIDGRPWWLASDGRRVVADLQLRAALRRAAGLGALPIVVDRAQDWSGEWPAIPGPVWFLRTTSGPLVVEAVGVREVA